MKSSAFLTVAAFLTALAPAVQAQQAAPPSIADAPPAPVAPRQPLSEQEFKELFAEKTITLSLNGAFYGAEQYDDGYSSVWRFAGGGCEYGVWRHIEEMFCFDYGAGPSCWRVFQQGEDVFAESINGGLLLKIESITQTPLRCDPPEVS